VTLVTEGDLFLEKVLQAIPLIALTVVKEPPATATATATAVTILHKKVPSRLPAGPVLVVDPAAACDLWELGEPLANPIVTQQDKDSPLLAHVRLDNVTMPEARKLTPKGPARAQVLASSLTGDPLLCTFDRPEGKVLVLTVDLDKSDLPLQTAFPIMVSNALAWFVGGQGELRESLAAGAVTEVELSAPGKGERRLVSPDGRSRALPDGPTRATLGPLDRCGIWTVSRASEPGKATVPPLELACNLASLQESDLRPADGLEARTARAGLGFGAPPVWFGLIAAAWGLAGREWCLYQRRWIS
jgi:hypothetical protein